MSNAISTVTQPSPPEQAPAASAKASESKTTQAAQTPQTTKTAQATQTPTDTVQISSASKAIVQEAQETHAQTIHEAAGGDSQARRLLAKEAAAANPTKA